MFGDHLEDMRVLMGIKRYQNKFKHKERSVAEHSWFVVKIAHGLGIWEKEKFGDKSIDIEKLFFLATNHDIAEVYTGDIVSTTKNLSPILKEELEKVDRIIFQTEIIKKIPLSWGDRYLEIQKEMSELNTKESRIVKASDILDRVFECMEEIKLCNREPYQEILERDLKKLVEMNLMSVNYFLKYSIKDIDGYKYIAEKDREKLESLDFSEYF